MFEVRTYSNSGSVEALFNAVSDNERGSAPQLADFDIELFDDAPVSRKCQFLHFAEWGERVKRSLHF